MNGLNFPISEVVARQPVRKPDADECPTHPGSTLPACRHCLIDARVDGNRAAVAAWYAAVQAEEFTQRAPVVFAQARPTLPQVAMWVAEFTVNPSASPWLLLSGPVGVGKTHEGYGAVYGAATSGHRLVWEAKAAGELFASLRPSPGVDTEARMRHYQECDLFLVDDLGASKNSDWVEEVTHRIINARYENRRPTIITTNVVVPELKNVLGGRIASRLAEVSRVVRMTGPDRRRTTNKGNNE